jgi:hypothetical protein
LSNEVICGEAYMMWGFRTWPKEENMHNLHMWAVATPNIVQTTPKES